MASPSLSGSVANNISSEFFELLTRYQEIVSKGLGILGIKPKLKM